ncbi:unnamed protein product [Leptosia nina]|uniref:Histone-lysine N-methyltransferase eggless n=1 Tax=Leptosia nina TaxID=320188 RepID=A0AAV1JEK2_9NEOP
MISETLHKTYESLQDVDTEKDIKDSEVEISDKTKENSDQDKMEDIIDTTIKQLAEDLASPKKCTVGTQDIKCILNATTSSTNNLNYLNNESSLNIHSKMTSFQSQFTEEATMPESNNVNKFKDSAKTDATETRTDDIEPKPSTSKLTNSGELSTESSKPDVIKSKPTGNLLEKDVSAQPSTSTTEVDMEAVDKLSIEKSNSEAPSASKETDEGIEQNTSDSLGLLAESSRIVVDDEDQEEEEDGDDEEEFDPDDESSNQMTIDQSEDSNTHQFESEVKKSAAGDKIDEIGDRPFEFNKDNNDETTEDNIHDIVNENEDEDEVTVEAQDSIDIVDHDEKETELAESRTSPEPSSNDPQTGVVNLDSEDESQDISEKKANVTSVNLPADIDVIASHSMKISTEIQVKAGEIIISGLTKPSHVKVKKIPAPEVYDLDSEDEMETDNRDMPEDTEEVRDIFQSKKRRKCVNDACPKLCDTFLLADNSTMSFYNGKNRHYVCEDCAYAVHQRNEKLIEGIRNLEDLLSLDFGRDSKDPIEVLDSDSDEEVDPKDLEDQIIGVKGAKFVEEELVVMINEQWEKYKMDSRLLDSVEIVKDQMAELERQSTELDNMLKECQISTDKFRNELYATFQPEITSLPAISIVDTPITDCVSLETTIETRQSKRRMSSQSETPPKRRLTQSQTKSQGSEDKDDDNTDITVVQLSTEEAPPDLPPAGEIKRPPLVAGMPVFVMRNMFGTWQKSRIVEFLSRGNAAQHTYTTCRIKFDRAQKNSFKVVTGRYVAYSEPANARMTIGTRVIALFQGSTENEEKQRETYYSGVVAEIPNPVNKFRYLIFFDDGYAQYASHANTRLVCEYSVQVWDEVHPFSRSFVKEYLLHYPQRPMVRLRAEQVIRTEWNDKWWKSKVIKVDASLVLVKFLLEKNRDRLEWIYRGSTRLEPLYLEMKAAERHRSRAMPRAQAHSRLNMPIVEYTRSDDQIKSAELQNIRELNNEEIRRQRAVAKKSTSAQAQQTPPPSVKVDFNSRVVYYTPKNAVRPFKITDIHICSPACKRKDVLALKELRTYNPLSKPLLSGWERQLVRSKNDKRVMYRAPCGRRIRNMDELLRYLQTIQSDMGVDLFDFGPSTHCLAEFIIDKFIVSKKDLSHGKENVPVPCVNYYDSSLPEFCSYNTERTPTAGVPLNLNPEFLCGCDCEGDCEDKSKCACWKMTLEGARTIGLEGENVGYAYKRLPEPLPSGIYECNSRCKCKSTCMNRVAQHPLQLKLQVFKTLNRGWGIRALNDVPKGSFLCIYAGNLLTDATANLDGLNEGDEYLAELDYIEVVEQMKEGYEEDIPESIKALDKKESDKTSEESESEEEEESEEEKAKNESEDDDFKPAPRCVIGGAQFNKRLRKRKKEEKKEKKEGQNEQNETAEKNTGASCITISDDEEVREPSRFNAASEIGENNYVSKYKSVRTLFGEDEACYIMDAKVQGNIGRYLNHSCCPNVFVQNVFVDTHDPRFPWSQGKFCTATAANRIAGADCCKWILRSPLQLEPLPVNGSI